MKKSLLLILGAAMLFAGCAKDLTSELDNLTSRVDQIEKQVESNKKAIEALQKANFISKVEQTATGWSVTLSDGSVLALYNGAAGADGKPGADGKDGDAFFKSVEVKDGMVIFTLTDGKVIEIPFAEEFALSLMKEISYLTLIRRLRFLSQLSARLLRRKFMLWQVALMRHLS